jgi:hypothetical protein
LLSEFVLFTLSPSSRSCSLSSSKKPKPISSKTDDPPRAQHDASDRAVRGHVMFVVDGDESQCGILLDLSRLVETHHVIHHHLVGGGQTVPSILAAHQTPSFFLSQYPIALPPPPSLVYLLSVPPTPRAEARHGDGFLTVSKTTEEWSVMTQQDQQIDVGEGGQVEGPWGCLKVRGPMVLSACFPRADHQLRAKSWLIRPPPTT